MRALIYCRNSKGVERSVDEQETEARSVCQREGWDVAEVVVDLVGASRHSKGARDGWKRAHDLVRGRKVDVLVTWESSRAQRDLDAYVKLRNLCVASGVLWSYSGRLYNLDDHEDRFRTALDALLAEREADEIASRVQRAVRANAVAGRPHGRRLFGYRRVYDTESGRLLGQELEPKEAAVVVRIFDDYLSGVGVRTIAAALNADGITTPMGKRWSDAQVRDVLARPSYAGYRVHRGEIIGDADWPALIDRDRWERTQARLEAKRTSNVRQLRRANLLSGVARCGVCGGKAHRGHDRKQRKVYACKARFCVARDLGKLDNYVTGLLLERLATLDAGGADAPPDDPESIEVAQLRQRLDDAVELFTLGKLSARLLAQTEARIQPQITMLEAAIRKRRIPIELDIPQDVNAWWDDLTPEQQREVVNATVAAVTLHRTTRGTRTFDPAAVSVEFRI